jgi:hypothetical protein
LFSREHHIRIATVLQALDADLLARHHCLFGGGTAIVLSHGEYRESLDLEFLVSERTGYQALRQMLTGENQINAIVRKGMTLNSVREIRADQYGIRTMLLVKEVEIKFEIVLEARIPIEAPAANGLICGIATLTDLDMATTKLLANSDRWHDDSVFSRDLIDLAMLDMPRPSLTLAIEKASHAYGDSIVRDLNKAVDALRDRKGRLEECMTALKINKVPKALLWNKLRNLKKSVL